jgi:hypothetical protein
VPPARRRFDLAIRAVAVAVFVSVIVAARSVLSANVTWIAAVVPDHPHQPARHRAPAHRRASRLADNALRPMLGFGVMLLSLHLAIKPWGTAAALVLALLVSVVWSAALLVSRREAPAIAGPLRTPVARCPSRSTSGSDPRPPA